VKDEYIKIAREVFDVVPWRLLKNGTVYILQNVPRPSDKFVLSEMSRLALALGPYEGEGSIYGDCRAMPLKKYPGWLVTFGNEYAHAVEGLTRLVTIVMKDEMATAPPPSKTEFMMIGKRTMPATKAPEDMRVALFGRHKRNLDARRSEIIANSIDA
jgi:hypothetical protein